MFANRSRWNSQPLSSVPRVAHANVRECIESHENNYTLIRIFLAISVIYFHSFALSNARHLQDHVSDFLLPITSVGGLAVEAFFFLSGLFVAQSLHRENKILSMAGIVRVSACHGYHILCDDKFSKYRKNSSV
jgi:hypothetical protein